MQLKDNHERIEQNEEKIKECLNYIEKAGQKGEQERSLGPKQLEDQKESLNQQLDII